jgi:hypothetical protein
MAAATAALAALMAASSPLPASASTACARGHTNDCERVARRVCTVWNSLYSPSFRHQCPRPMQQSQMGAVHRAHQNTNVREVRTAAAKGSQGGAALTPPALFPPLAAAFNVGLLHPPLLPPREHAWPAGTVFNWNGRGTRSLDRLARLGAPCCGP